jgi:hypothetical protein
MPSTLRVHVKRLCQASVANMQDPPGRRQVSPLVEELETLIVLKVLQVVQESDGGMHLVGAEAVRFQVHRDFTRRGKAGRHPLQLGRRVHIAERRRLQALE